MKRTLVWPVLAVAFFFLFTGCQQKTSEEDPSVAKVVISYLEAGSGKQLAASREVSKTGEDAIVSAEDFQEEIPSYTYLCSSVEGEVRAKMGETAEVSRYYVETGSYYKNGANLLIRHIDADSGKEIAPPMLISKEEAFEYTDKAPLSIEGYSYVVSDASNPFTVAQKNTRILCRYYKSGEGKTAADYAVLIVRYRDAAGGEELGSPAVYIRDDTFTLKREELSLEIEGYALTEDAAAEFIGEKGSVKEADLAYQAKDKDGVAEIKISFLLKDDESKVLAEEQVLQQKGEQLTISASQYAKEIEGYTYSSADADEVVAAPGESKVLKLYYTVAEQPKKGTATIVVHYYLKGTTTKLAADKTLTAEDQALSVTAEQYAQTIAGYTLASASPSETVEAQPGETKEIIRYYTKNSSGGSSGGNSNQSGTSSKQSQTATSKAPVQTPTSQVTPPKPSVPVQPAPAALYPAASGTVVYQTEGGYLDASNAGQGYVMARFTGDSSKRAKLRMVANGVTYNYDLDSGGKLETFGLNLGNGAYTISIWQQTSGTKYTQVFSQSINVSLAGSTLPFLYPNKIVNYSAGSAVVAKAKALCASARNDAERVAAVYAFAKTIQYDYNKAATVKSGYVPNPDSTLSTRTGICYDYAAVMAAMLRSQGIPTKLVMGNVSAGYHAWNEIYVKNAGNASNAIVLVANQYNRLDATFGASKSDSAMAQYLSNGSNYTVKYRY